jgi:hypothetical protein
MNTVAELVERARSAREGGDLLVARGYWRRATQVAPGRLDLWMELSQLTELPKERVRCLEHIVALDPDNARLQAELEQLRLITNPLPESAAMDDEAPGPGPEVAGASGAADKPLFCVHHPGRETRMRCNLCDKPICPKCAVHTPVGFRCKACVKAQQSDFYTARWYDYPLSAGVAFGLSVAAAMVASQAGWWLTLFAGPLAGGLVGKAVHAAIGRRRGRWIWLTCAVSIVVGTLVAMAVTMQPVPISIYAVTATGAAVGVLRLRRGR